MPSAVATKRKLVFDPDAFLNSLGRGRKGLRLHKGATIFSQGDPCRFVYYIRQGRVKLSVVSLHGREAVIALLGPGDFFGEGCLNGQARQVATATAVGDCSLQQIDGKLVAQALHREHAFSDLFVAYLLERNLRMQEDLVDHLFNSSEKRLARVLLLLAHFGKPGKPEPVIPKISQETLAAMVGTTRSRVSHFMNRFRKLGFVSYNGGLEVHSSLVNIFLHD